MALAFFLSLWVVLLSVLPLSCFSLYLVYSVKILNMVNDRCYGCPLTFRVLSFTLIGQSKSLVYMSFIPHTPTHYSMHLPPGRLFSSLNPVGVFFPEVLFIFSSFRSIDKTELLQHCQVSHPLSSNVILLIHSLLSSCLGLLT